MKKAVLMSINKPHTDNMNCGLKTSELRTNPPKIPCPFKVYVYETLAYGGCGKVVSEWICNSMTEWLMYMGVPAHLSKTAYISDYDILQYCHNGKKNITEMNISNLVVYDKPRDLGEFKPWHRKCSYADLGFAIPKCEECHDCKVERAPQSWCYVEEV